MITLITGTPGASKTLNAIDLVLNDPAFQERPVYVYNIELLAPGEALGWQTLDLEQAKAWYDLPHGAVIILDECQDLFPPEKFGNKVPEHIRRLNTHRHLGIDLVLITQHPKLIDTKVRRLVGQHFHFKRQFGLQSATRFTFQECADDPSDYFAQKAATKTRKRFNKKLFGLYKSAEVHTHKRKIPWMVWALLVLIIVTGYTIYSVVANFGQSDSVSSPGPTPDNVTTQANNAPGQPAPARREGQPLTREQYLEQWSPRVKSIPHSAPVYDQVYVVRDFPRPQCLLREKTDQCRCYTQQATPLEVPEAQCRQIVAHGYWDPTREPPQDKGTRNPESSNSTQATGAHERNMEALRIRVQTQAMNY
ncbi:zonular occludens toxin domain-containing protein [Marinobacter sp. THAF197a]|uniref:zonular occludens toxin domain-containing protein n=1 Tax=Marinobacter sp. THAF197a TaxID=2587869 RepID=UPI0012693350|nr:zonular occludens toxin domain-containing protein [Marinobacter sp. THAF197a]QFS86024.1 Zonular occludens toxin (Zot) [Marinobacter sp. THAF197a]